MHQGAHVPCAWRMAHPFVSSADPLQQSGKVVLRTTNIIQVQHHLQLWDAHMAVPFLHMNILVSRSPTQCPVQMPGQCQVPLLHSKQIQHLGYAQYLNNPISC